MKWIFYVKVVLPVSPGENRIFIYFMIDWFFAFEVIDLSQDPVHVERNLSY